MASNATVVVAHEDVGNAEVTVVEVVKPDAATPAAEAPSENIVEEIIDAILDPFSEDEAVAVPPGGGLPEAPMMFTTDTDFGSPTFDLAAGTDIAAGEADASSPVIDSATAPADAEVSAGTEPHAEAASDLQAKTDDAIAAGDYEAASHLRDSAEDEAWTAGDSSMLHGSDSVHLESAARDQQDVAYYEREEATHAQAGDYEAARDDASNAEFATKSADWEAGGADHSAQAADEYQHMDSAVFQEQWATEDASTAASYAADGDLEHEAQYAESAAEHQEAADYQGDLGEHGGPIADYDGSADVDTSSTVDTSVDDTSSAVSEESSTDS